MTPLRTRVTARAAVAALAAFATQAHAHLVETGLGPVYDGIAHFALTPEDLIPALALAVLAGLRGTAHARRAIFALPLAWLVAGCAVFVVTTLAAAAAVAWQSGWLRIAWRVAGSWVAASGLLLLGWSLR